MATYPQLDLLTVPDDLELRLQSEQVLDLMHTVSEDNSYFYSIAHKALNLAAGVSIDTPRFVAATDTGAKIFEAVGYSIRPDASYEGQNEKVLTIVGAQQFVDFLRRPEDYEAICDYAATRMQEDAPLLTELITEIAGRYTEYDDVATRFAVKGAAAIRGMQIFVDKKLEAVS